jgi:hypothetical protein
MVMSLCSTAYTAALCAQGVCHADGASYCALDGLIWPDDVWQHVLQASSLVMQGWCAWQDFPDTIARWCADTGWCHAWRPPNFTHCLGWPIWPLYPQMTYGTCLRTLPTQATITLHRTLTAATLTPFLQQLDRPIAWVTHSPFFWHTLLKRYTAYSLDNAQAYPWYHHWLKVFHPTMTLWHQQVHTPSQWCKRLTDWTDHQAWPYDPMPLVQAWSDAIPHKPYAASDVLRHLKRLLNHAMPKPTPLPLADIRIVHVHDLWGLSVKTAVFTEDAQPIMTFPKRHPWLKQQPLSPDETLKHAASEWRLVQTLAPVAVNVTWLPDSTSSAITPLFQAPTFTTHHTVNYTVLRAATHCAFKAFMYHHVALFPEQKTLTLSQKVRYVLRKLLHKAWHDAWPDTLQQVSQRVGLPNSWRVALYQHLTDTWTVHTRAAGKMMGTIGDHAVSVPVMRFDPPNVYVCYVFKWYTWMQHVVLPNAHLQHVLCCATPWFVPNVRYTAMPLYLKQTVFTPTPGSYCKQCHLHVFNCHHVS